MSERRKVDINRDTTQITEEVLSFFPADCVKDRGRLCGVVTTAIARAEFAEKWGVDRDETLSNALEMAVAVDKHCLEGITIDEDRRTECGYDKGFSRPVNTHPEWLFPDQETTDGNV